MNTKQNKLIKSDEVLKKEILDLLFESYSIDASAIDVEVQNRVVTLKGFVPSYDELIEARRKVENHQGVRDVINLLEVKRFRDKPLSQTGFETGFS